MAVNFFGQQDLARRNTRILVILFSLAVLLLITLTNLLLLVVFGFIDTSDHVASAQNPVVLSWQAIYWCSAIVIVSVTIAILIKWLQLRAGGKAVAESLGGQKIAVNTSDPALRRLLNIVEEMALAANLPVPPVYLLPEAGINAFAAGYSQADAVIGVTRGCIEQLNRDELQGVIAHEFSHILNGDMRMNIRIIAILNGILFIGHAGYYLMRSTGRGRSSKNNGAAALLFLGLGLLAIGYLGSFFGNLIKAAVSRQREFLADASAVQFTRNPAGIADALKRIGAYSAGTKIQNENADEASHLFFGEAISRWASLLATHPPLAHRIKRLEPNWDGNYPKPLTKKDLSKQKSATQPPQDKARTVLNTVLPLLLLENSHQQHSAQAVVLGVLLHDNTALADAQLTLLQQDNRPELAEQTQQMAALIQPLPLLQKIQLLQRCIPALKELKPSQFQQFDQWLQGFIKADKQTDFLEWAAASFVEATVATQFSQVGVGHKARATKLNAVQPQLLQLIAALANTAPVQQQIKIWHLALQRLKITDIRPLPATDYDTLTVATRQLAAAAPAVKQKMWQLITAIMTNNTEQQQALLTVLALLLEIPWQPNT